jgi:hypothetical protein
MQTLFKCLYGSHLYGCATPKSDKDYKGIFLFSLDELIRRKADNVQWKDEEKNEEHEMYYAKRYIDLLSGGQTVAYSMLFAPDNMILETSAAWEFLRLNKHRVVSKMLKPFVGYARSQAQKYSIKGEKLSTLDMIIQDLQYLEQHSLHRVPNHIMSPYWDHMVQHYDGKPGVRFWVDTKGGVDTRLMEVCGRSFGETTAIKNWLEPLINLRKTYGSRALEAKESNGMDLKALYHAVRICSEMNEILKDGTITYPRPEAELLMDIRTGKLTNGEISCIIDKLMEEGDALFLTSKLPEKSDTEFLESWYVGAQTLAIEKEL